MASVGPWTNSGGALLPDVATRASYNAATSGGGTNWGAAIKDAFSNFGTSYTNAITAGNPNGGGSAINTRPINNPPLAAKGGAQQGATRDGFGGLVDKFLEVGTGVTNLAAGYYQTRANLEVLKAAGKAKANSGYDYSGGSPIGGSDIVRDTGQFAREEALADSFVNSVLRQGKRLGGELGAAVLPYAVVAGVGVIIFVLSAKAAK